MIPTSFPGSGGVYVKSLTHSVSFLKSMIRSGLQHPLEMEDLGKPSSALDVEALREKFRVEWDNGNRSLLMASIRATSPPMWIASIVYYTIGILMTFIPSMILEALLNEYGKENPSRYCNRP